MTISRKASELKVGEMAAISFGAYIGCQWALIESVEVGDTETTITVKMAKRFGQNVVSKVYLNQERFACQDFVTFSNWLKMNKLDDFL